MTLHEHAVRLEVTPLSATIGAEIRGVDLRDIDDATVAQIREIWLDRKVVFFPGQHLTAEEHLAFALRFGEPTEGHPVIRGTKENPEIFRIDYTLARKLVTKPGSEPPPQRGIDWHTDVTYMRRPPMGSILRAVTIPESGGDTMFSDQHAAYESLSPTMKEFLGTLTAMHESVKGLVQQRERERARAVAEPKPASMMETAPAQEAANLAAREPATPAQAPEPPRRSPAFIRDIPFESTEDLVAAARRAAQAAAARAAQRDATLRQPSAAVQEMSRPAAEPGRHKMSLLMVVAAVLLMISAALLFTRLKSKPDLEAPPPAAEHSIPAPAAEAPLPEPPYQPEVTPSPEREPAPPADAMPTAPGAPTPAPSGMGTPPVRLGGTLPPGVSVW